MDSLAAVADEVTSCRKCPRLVEWREDIAEQRRAAYRDFEYWGRGVPAFGDPDAHLVVVGLAPAAHGANRTGRMFTGDRSGDFLFSALHRTGYASQPNSDTRDDGLELSGCIITSPVKCAPPANKPTPAERDNCIGYFRRELALLPNATVILALGQIAYQAAATSLGLAPRPKFGHGVEAELPDGRLLICSFHVSQQNTFTKRLTPEMFDEVLLRCRERALSR